MRNIHKIVGFILGMAVLAACSTIPITSLPKLAGLNPQSFDFSEAKIAVRIQDGYRVEDGDVTLMVHLLNGATQEQTSETFNLVVEPMPDSEFLIKEKRSGTTIYGLSFDDGDKARVLSFRDKFSAITAQNSDGPHSSQNSFSLNVNTKGCLEKGANPFTKMRYKVYLKPSQKDDYFTFTKEQKIDLASTEQGQMPRCKSD